MTSKEPPIDSLIKKLEAKICGNYSEREAYGRGLDSAFTVAIEIIRDHFASEISVVDKYLAWARHMPDCAANLHLDEICDCGLLDLRIPEPVMIDPDMPAQDLRLHMGEMTAQEICTARAAIRWANSVMGGANPKLADARLDASGVRRSVGRTVEETPPATEQPDESSGDHAVANDANALNENSPRTAMLNALCKGYDLVRPLHPEELRANRWRMANALSELERSAPMREIVDERVIEALEYASRSRVHIKDDALFHKLNDALEAMRGKQ